MLRRPGVPPGGDIALPGAYGAVDPLFLLLAALTAEAYLGALDWGGAGWSWPKHRFDELLRSLARRLDRPERSRGALARRGALAAVLVLAVALAAGVLLGLFTRHYPFAWALELLLLVAALRLRRSHRLGRAVLSALERGDADAARAALARLGARDIAPEAIQGLPRQGLAVTARTLLERRLADGAVAPALWFGLLGLPGLFAWSATQRAALVLNGLPVGASPSAASAVFAGPSARLAAALRWPAARLGGMLLALAGRLRSGRPPATPLDALAAALDRHALAGLLIFAAVVLPIVARLLLRAHVN